MSKFLLILITVLTSTQLFAEDEVGNGGDHIRMVFEEARLSALAKLAVWSQVSQQTSDDKVTTFLDANSDQLYREVGLSKLIWQDDLPEMCKSATCACTKKSPLAPIYLSLKNCTVRFINREYAEKILVHEAVHHLGVDDEVFADHVSLAVFKGQPDRQSEKYAALGPVSTQANQEKPAARLDYVFEAYHKQMIVEGADKNYEAFGAAAGAVLNNKIPILLFYEQYSFTTSDEFGYNRYSQGVASGGVNAIGLRTSPKLVGFFKNRLNILGTIAFSRNEVHATGTYDGGGGGWDDYTQTYVNDDRNYDIRVHYNRFDVGPRLEYKPTQFLSLNLMYERYYNSTGRYVDSLNEEFYLTLPSQSWGAAIGFIL